MNATVPSVLRIVSNRSHSMTVQPWGFAMECEYEYDPGEPTIWHPAELSHPGSPPNVALLSCKVGGVDLMEMLSFDQQERIEGVILDQLENY
jgi:hypothetical protein